MLAKLRLETKQFCNELDKILIRQSSAKSPVSTDSKHIDWDSIKRAVITELDEMFVPMSDIDMTRVIGKGATSSVYIGSYRFCSVAIKKIKLNSLTPKQIANIVNEAICLKKINHPNVIALYAVSIDQKQNLYLVTELCEQLSLKSFFKKFKQKIPPAVKIRIIMDIAKALYHIHSEKLGITHRDIKPENILLTGDLKAKLADFGIAKCEGHSIPVPPEEKLDTIATLQYMAPECMLKGQYAPSSDMYSFGVLAWELLHEREAFAGLTEFNLIESVVSKKCTLDYQKGLIPDDVALVLKNCLAVAPEERPVALKICSKLDEYIKSSKK